MNSSRKGVPVVFCQFCVFLIVVMLLWLFTGCTEQHRFTRTVRDRLGAFGISGDIKIYRTGDGTYGLDLQGTDIVDLTSISGLPLTWLILPSTVSNLEPLRGMPLNKIGIYGASITNWAPLIELPVSDLFLKGMKVENLSFLEGTRLSSLILIDTKIRDLSPLMGLPLGSLAFDPHFATNVIGVISAIPTLREISTNGVKFMTVEKFFRQTD